MNFDLTTTIITFILAATPISVVAATQINKLFSGYDWRLHKLDTVCTKINGILTKNILTVKSLTFDKYQAKIKEEKDLIEIKNLQTNENLKIENEYFKQDPIIRLIFITTHLCHFPKIKKFEDTIKNFFYKCKFTKGAIERKYKKIAEIPLNENKKISTIVAQNTETLEIFAFSKGNPTDLLKKCSRILINNEKVELTKERRRKIRKKIRKLNKNGQKLIGFAYKGLPKKIFDKYTEQFTENDLVFLGMIGLGNPLNKEIIKDIQNLKNTGIKILITSLAKERKTVAIGKHLKIINPQYFESIPGDYFESLSDQKIRKILSNQKKDFIFPRFKEKSQKRLIKILKTLNKTIIVISKKSPNTFKTILGGIKKTRISKENIYKIFNHAFSCKLAEITLLITALILKTPLVLTLTMIIILDIFINLPLELALKKDKIEKNVLDPNYKISSRIFNKSKIFHLISNTVFIATILVITYIHSLIRYGWGYQDIAANSPEIFSKAMTLSFVLLAIIQIINSFNFRDYKKSLFNKNTFSNPYLILISIISILIIYILLSFSYFNDYLGIAALSIIDWQIISFAALSIILLEEIKKFIIRLFQTNDDKSSKNRLS